MAASAEEIVASNAAKAAADESVEQMNPLVLFDALANEGAVRPKEFALVIQLEASAVLNKMASDMVDQGQNMGVVTPDIAAGLKPALKRGVQHLDVAHMRTLLEMLFRVMDGNKNGKIEREEFEGFLNKFVDLIDLNPEKCMDFAFSMVDKNGNGKLSLDEAQGVIDSVLELATSLVASVADVAENIINDPDVKAIAIKTMKQGLSQNGLVEGDDFSNLISRDDLVKSLEDSGVMEQMAEFFSADNSQNPMQKGVTSSMKTMRESFAKFESSVGAQFYMKALEWGQGGVDEATFLCQVVPLIREKQKEELEKLEADPMAMIQQQLDAAGATMNDEMKAMVTQTVQAASAEVLPALKRGNERASEYLPEYARALFRFLDIDGSGTITKKEIQLLKALLDALLHLGERACHDMSGDEVKPMTVDYKANAKELAFAIFDVLDRDGDKHLSLEEIVTFAQKYLTFLLSMVRTMAHMTIECTLDELCKAMASMGWKAAGLEEVEKEQFLPMMMMAPMAVQGMMMQASGAQSP